MDQTHRVVAQIITNRLIHFTDTVVVVVASGVQREGGRQQGVANLRLRGRVEGDRGGEVGRRSNDNNKNRVKKKRINKWSVAAPAGRAVAALIGPSKKGCR